MLLCVRTHFQTKFDRFSTDPRTLSGSPPPAQHYTNTLQSYSSRQRTSPPPTLPHALPDMPLTIFLHRIGRQRIVETRLNKVLVLGLEAECPPAWPACSSPGAIWLGYVPNLPARACWMDALRRDSPTPVCSLCVTVCMVLCHLGCTCASVFFTSTWV